MKHATTNRRWMVFMSFQSLATSEPTRQVHVGRHPPPNPRDVVARLRRTLTAFAASARQARIHGRLLPLEDQTHRKPDAPLRIARLTSGVVEPGDTDIDRARTSRHEL